MSEHGSCERCGEPATRVETATHLFCTTCQELASTGARASGELLFTLAAERERTTHEDLASLTRPAAERASLSPLLAYGPAIIAPPRPRARRAPSLLAGGAAFFALTTVALAWHALPSAPAELPPVEPKALEARAKAQPVSRAPVLAEELEPIAPPAEPVAELAPRPEPATPPSIDPRPAARAPRATPARTSPPVPESGDLLDELIGSARPRTVAAPSGPRVPAQRDVSLTMRALEDDVAACTDDAYGMVTTRITFTGESGRVLHAEVVGAAVPDDVRSCIARALRGAEVPTFAQERFTVAYPFRI